MNRSELAIVIIFRVLGVTALGALPVVFFPHSWMNAIHDYAGLGDMPDTPIVGYLARSLSAFYAIMGTITLLISSDIRRYRPFVKLWAVLHVAMGFVLLGIDVAAGLPGVWTCSEGPLTLVIGLVIVWLERSIDVPSAL